MREVSAKQFERKIKFSFWFSHCATSVVKVGQVEAENAFPWIKMRSFTEMKKNLLSKHDKYLSLSYAAKLKFSGSSSVLQMQKRKMLDKLLNI